MHGLPWPDRRVGHDAFEKLFVCHVTSRTARVRTTPLCHEAIASLNIDVALFYDMMPTTARRRRSGRPKFGLTNFQTLQMIGKT
jgi:hypothetical protein